MYICFKNGGFLRVQQTYVVLIQGRGWRQRVGAWGRSRQGESITFMSAFKQPLKKKMAANRITM